MWTNSVPGACVGGVVDLEVELRVKLVLHHAPVADQTAGREGVQGGGVKGGDLGGTEGVFQERRDCDDS